MLNTEWLLLSPIVFSLLLWSRSVVKKQQMFLLCTTREVEFPHEGSSSSSSSFRRSPSLTYITYIHVLPLWRHFKPNVSFFWQASNLQATERLTSFKRIELDWNTYYYYYRLEWWSLSMLSIIFLTRLISSSNREDVFFGYYPIKVLSWQVYVQSCLFRSTAAAAPSPLWKKKVCVIFSCFLSLFAPRLSGLDSTAIFKTGKHIGGSDDSARSKVIPT